MSSDSELDQVFNPGVADEPEDRLKPERFFRRYTPRIRAFLSGERDITVWEPPVSWFDLGPRADEELDRTRSLGMPRLFGQDGDYYPDMLLYGLGNLEMLDDEYAHRLSDFVSGDSHIYLCNASGTGKTRLVFETLSRHWGFYFTCFYNIVSDPYGSRDFQSALTTIQMGVVDGQSLRSIPRLSGKGSHDASVTIATNRSYAARLLRRVLLARLLVLDHYCSLVRELAIPDDVARRKWFLLQLRPTELVNSDLFESLVLYIDDVPDDQVAGKLHELYSTHLSRITFVAVDEAQVALKPARKYFVYNNGRRYAALLREVVCVLGNHMPACRIIISGTELDLDMVSDGIESSLSHHRTLRFFHDLGAFRSRERIERYLSHFLGPDLASERAALVHTWLRGRHRLIAVLVMCTLMAGDSFLETVMDTIVFCLTGYRRNDAVVLSMINIDTAIRDQQLEDFPHAHLLRRAVLSFARREREAIQLDYAPELIRLGVALFEYSGTTATIFEPFVFLTLCRWIQGSPLYSWRGLIRRRSTNEVSLIDDVQFLEAVATFVFEMSVLWGLSLRQYMRFLGVESPWTSESGTLVMPRIRGRFPKFSAVGSNSAFSLVETASTSEDVFTWFREAEKPFLVPDPDFGASMLCFLSVSNSKNVVLVCFHTLSASRSRRVQACSPYDPGDFYRSAPQTAQRLKSILRSLPNLPVTFPAKAGSGSRTRIRPARFGVVQVVCFADVSDPSRIYDPPVAILDFTRLWTVNDVRAVEIDFDHVTSAI